MRRYSVQQNSVQQNAVQQIGRTSHNLFSRSSISLSELLRQIGFDKDLRQATFTLVAFRIEEVSSRSTVVDVGSGLRVNSFRQRDVADFGCDARGVFHVEVNESGNFQTIASGLVDVDEQGASEGM